MIRDLGTAPYEAVWHAMQAFTDCRGRFTPDEFWLVEHPPVFTLGRNGQPSHLLNPGDIPVIDSDRGGQVTYHGPGQAVVYTLVDIQRQGIGIRAFVRALEDGVTDALATAGIAGQPESGAPGIYVNGAKIASLGLRVRRGCTYHGISLNVAMDLAPFHRINPCGRVGMQMTQCSDFGAAGSVGRWSRQIAHAVAAKLERPVADQEAPGGLDAVPQEPQPEI